MAKPIIGYALARQNYGHLGFMLLGVTSCAHCMTYGRAVPSGKISHVADYDVIHRFPEGTTEAEALAGMARAEEAYERMRKPIAEAHRQVERMLRHQRASVLDAAKHGPAKPVTTGALDVF